VHASTIPVQSDLDSTPMDCTITAFLTTALCLVERHDHEGIPPPDLRSENEIKLFSHEEDGGHRPYLEVSWDSPPATPDGCGN